MFIQPWNANSANKNMTENVNSIFDHLTQLISLVTNCIRRPTHREPPRFVTLWTLPQGLGSWPPWISPGSLNGCWTACILSLDQWQFNENVWNSKCVYMCATFYQPESHACNPKFISVHLDSETNQKFQNFCDTIINTSNTTLGVECKCIVRNYNRVMHRVCM